METGSYASLSQLYEGVACEGIIDQELYNAWDGHDTPEPLGGWQTP